MSDKIKTSITYSTNWMGPINKKWVDEHGSNWAGGRIDIRENVDTSGYSEEELENMSDAEYYSLYQLSPFGEEYGLPIMNAQDYVKLSDWLETLETDTLIPYNDLIEKFETETETNIRWFKQDC